MKSLQERLWIDKDTLAIFVTALVGVESFLLKNIKSIFKSFQATDDIQKAVIIFAFSLVILIISFFITYAIHTHFRKEEKQETISQQPTREEINLCMARQQSAKIMKEGLKAYQIYDTKDLETREKLAEPGDEIWILTSDTSNKGETALANIRQRNIERGVDYTYFISNAKKIFDSFQAELTAIYGETEHVFAIPLDDKFNLLFDLFDVTIYKRGKHKRAVLEVYICVDFSQPYVTMPYRKFSPEEARIIDSNLIKIKRDYEQGGK